LRAGPGRQCGHDLIGKDTSTVLHEERVVVHGAPRDPPVVHSRAVLLKRPAEFQLPDRELNASYRGTAPSAVNRYRSSRRTGLRR